MCVGVTERLVFIQYTYILWEMMCTLFDVFCVCVCVSERERERCLPN